MLTCAAQAGGRRWCRFEASHRVIRIPTKSLMAHLRFAVRLLSTSWMTNTSDDPSRFKGTPAEGMLDGSMPKPIWPPGYSSKVNTFVGLEVQPSGLGPHAGLGVYAAQDIKRNTVITQYGDETVAADDPRRAANWEYSIQHHEHGQVILGGPWQGQVPALAPPLIAVGHIINDAGGFSSFELLIELGQKVAGMRSFDREVVEKYEVPSLVGANAQMFWSDKDRRLLVLATRDVEAGQELFQSYGRRFWMIRDVNMRMENLQEQLPDLDPWRRLLIFTFLLGTSGIQSEGFIAYSPKSKSLRMIGSTGQKEPNDNDCRSFLEEWLCDSVTEEWWDNCLHRLQSDSKLLPAWRDVKSLQRLDDVNKLLFLYEHVMHT